MQETIRRTEIWVFIGENQNLIKLHQLGAEMVSEDKMSDILESDGMRKPYEKAVARNGKINTRRLPVTEIMSNFAPDLDLYTN